MLILASASPRRQELLRNAGIAFQVEPADIDETPRANESAQQCAERLAQEKALAVALRHPGECVLGADTVVAIDGIILGKPSDDEDAARMLRMLSGRRHEVITGVCLVSAERVPGRGGRDQELGASSLRTESRVRSRALRTASVATIVTMCELSPEDIRDYVGSGEPMDKAGAYAIQGLASRWIPLIEGDYSSVVGLPIALVYRMLGEVGEL